MLYARSTRQKKTPGSLNSQRSSPLFSRPLQLPSDDSLGGAGEPSERVVSTVPGLRPQVIKKGGRECRQQQGDERVENAGVTSSTTLFRQAEVPWASLTNCEKRSGPTRSQFDALPLHRRSNRRITQGSLTGRRHYDQTTTGVSNPRKSRGPTLCSVRRIHPLSDDALLCSHRYKPFRHR